MAMEDRQQMAAHVGSHGRNAGEQGQIVFQAGVAIDVIVDISLQLGERLIQEGHGVLAGVEDARRGVRGQGFSPAVPLPAKILGERLAAGQQGLEFAGFRGGGCHA